MIDDITYTSATVTTAVTIGDNNDIVLDKTDSKDYGYIYFNIKPYSPDKETYDETTIASYPITAFDSLTPCQKKIWATINHIKWSGITDNMHLDGCGKTDLGDWGLNFTYDINYTVLDLAQADASYSSVNNVFGTLTNMIGYT